MIQKSFVQVASIAISFFLLLLWTSSCSTSTVLNPTIEEEEVDPPTPTPPVVDSDEAKETIAFYNVENLFDTVDDPENGGDNEFLPTAPKQWTMERYIHKLNNIGKVIEGIGFPIIMGVSEVENGQVMEDLTKIEALADHPYSYVHEESPDHRGIDVGLLYQPAFFEVLEWETIEVDIPDPVIEDYTTRDILLVKGQMEATTIYIFVVHWPSRSGGTEKSEFRRIFVAEVLKDAIDQLQTTTPDASIIIMGDFNDEPTNRSIKEVLAVQAKGTTIDAQSLYNCTSTLDAAGEGSYNYQGNWQMIDQIITTGNLVQPDNPIQVTDFKVFKDEMLLFNHPNNGPTPDRTYGGDQYYGGFSDHLAVYVEIGRK